MNQPRKRPTRQPDSVTPWLTAWIVLIIGLILLVLVAENAVAGKQYDRPCRHECEPIIKIDKRVTNGDRIRTTTATGGDGGAGGIATVDVDGGSAYGGESNSTVDFNIEAGDSTAEIDSNNSASVEGGTTTVSVTQEYEAVAEAVASLNLAYCSDGGGVGDKNASFNVAGVNYICEVTMALPVMLSTVKADLSAGRVNDAQDTLAEVRAMTHEVYEYIDARGDTAIYGAFFRDTWWLFAILLVAL